MSTDNKLSYTICEFDPKYRIAFRELNLEWISKYFKVEEKDLAQLNDPEKCIREGGQIFFVVINNEAIATCALYNEGQQRYELAKMAVRPDYQGRGLSDVLMRACDEWALKQRAREIYLVSNTSLTPAITLYKKHGYEIVRLGQDPIYERGDIEMVKRF